nr:trans-cinnamate 4-monooxygenase [Quercus suber]
MDLLFLEKLLLSLFFTILLAIFNSKLRGKRFKLPPGPIPVPIFGNWLQVKLAMTSTTATSPTSLANMVTFSCSAWANATLPKRSFTLKGSSLVHELVFDIFTGKGQDMVFTVYGEHWRKMRRIMTVPFFTNKVAQQYRFGWEEEIARVVDDVKKIPEASTTGRFESEDGPLFVRLKTLNGERSRLAQSFVYNYGDFIPILRPFLRGYLKICKEVKERRLQVFKDYFLEERKKLASTKSTDNNALKCAIDHILDAQQKGEINEDSVLYIVENINVAGVQITEPDTHKLPYLQAVIKETLRLRMAIPLLVPHMNLHDAKLGGFDIPAESKILVNALWLANNPANWKNPQVFGLKSF